MMNGNKQNRGLAAMIPEVRRMRDYHLYGFNGKRYLDLFLDGGRAMLGHKPGKTVLMMKNSLEKGLSAAYPGIYSGRLLKQLKMIFPQIKGCSVIFAGRDTSSVFGEGFGEESVIFRPLEVETPPAGVFEFLLPLPGSSLVRVLCADKSASERLPEPDAVPPYLLSGLCRSAAELAAFMKTADNSVWNAFDSGLWIRRGPWLYPEVSSEDYPSVFERFLENGILLSPYHNIPSCAPYRFTDGEIKPIRKIEKELC